MNILICGKKTPFTGLLVERLNREKNEIHYISGSKSSEKIEKGVFQQFDFEYQNPNISRIVRSAKADLMIISGMCDRNYSWVNIGNDVQSFVSGVSSLLMAARNTGVKRVIFISSINIFENNLDEEIKSDTRAIPTSAILDACVQAESLCREFRSDKMQIDILRLPEVTGFYEKGTAYDFCLEKAQDYLKKQVVLCVPEQVHNVVFYKDAVEAVFRLIGLKNEKENHTYQIQGLTFTEREYINELIATGMNKKAAPGSDRERECKEYPPTALSETDEERLGLSLHFDVKGIAEALVKDCLRFRKEEDADTRKRFNVLPLIEALVLAAATGFVTYWLRQTWVGDSISLYLLFVILFGAVYGTAYGLLSGFLAALGTLIVCWGDKDFVGSLENYTFFLGFLQFVLAGVIAGYMRDKYNRRNSALTEEKNYLSAEVDDLSKINDNNIYVKNEYEKRLIAYDNSLSRIYELTSELDYMESHKVMFQAARLSKELLGVDDVAIYMSSQRSSYYRLIAATSKEATMMGKSFKYDENAFLYQDFEQREIFKNRKMDNRQPTFAGAVWDKDHIITIIMVWTRDIRKVNLYESDMFAIMCRLIEKSMSRAAAYEEALRKDSYIEGTHIMKKEPFRQIYQEYLDGRKQGLFDYTMLSVDPSGHELTEVQSKVRDTDIIALVDGIIYIILPFSSSQDAEFVIRRFFQNGMTLVPVNEDAEKGIVI